MVSVPKQLLIQLLLILLNAFFASMEMAVVSLNQTKLKVKIEEGDKKAEKLLKYVESPAQFLSTIQVGITLAGFLGSAFAADALSEPLVNLFRSWGLVAFTDATLNTIAVIIITIILSFFTLIFGELVPKRIAQQMPYKWAKTFVGFIGVLTKMMTPIIWLLSGTTNLVLRILHLKTTNNGDSVSEADIRMMVDVGGEKGTIEEDELEMIQNIFDFNDISVSEIMTRKSDVVAFSSNDSDEEILAGIKESGNSRFPIYKEDDDNDVLGILNSREFLLNLSEGKPKTVAEMLRPAYFIPESIKADKLFNDMQMKKVHIAIVIDEYGDNAGIITLEDLLEEIVGNIYDEYDPQENPEIEKIGDNLWKVSGSMDIEELADELNIEIPEDRDYDTVGGLVLSCLNEIPKDGDCLTVESHNLHVEVTKVEERRIVEANISILPEEDEKKKDRDEERDLDE